MPQTISRHHAEWLSLLEISGPFLSMPVLLNIFPQGLDEFSPDQARSLKADYEYWKENIQDPAVFTAWVRLVLETLLGFSAEVLQGGQAIPAGIKAEFPEHDETLRPEWILIDPRSHKPRLLIQVYPPGQGLDRSPAGSHWQASVATRMMELLHATEVRLGLVTNGEQWMLVDAPRGETTGLTSWYAGLWFDERLTLQAFRALLGAQRFFGVPDDQTIEGLLTASAQDQHEITNQLGLQVRRAVEILVQMLDRSDQERNGELLGHDVPPALLYEAALTFMMRLVFMLSAEERKLLQLDDNIYAENYAVSTLRAQLRELADQQGEEVLERREDAWTRLLAVFRAVYHGIRHDRLHLPPYGGSLFNPDRFPFLEGRPPGSHWQETPAQSIKINNRTVLHLLDALQILQVQVPGGGPAEARRLSFRALDVEQIGHVYEGLLDHVAVRAKEPVLGLRGAKRQEPEVLLSSLEQAAEKKEPDYIAWLNDQTGRSLPALKNSLASDMLQKDQVFTNRLRAACGNDERLFARITPFAGLIRTDDFGFPVVILPGSVYVTAGTTRRATGTHYTPRSLTEPIVQHTLEPLVYMGPAEGWPREKWRLRSASELLDLKICDMAMGSAGFLVQADRYLAERVVEAWGQDEETKTDNHGSWSAIQGLSSDEDRLLYARRLVAERCLYGVDKNPLAVEIAKLSLWLVTLAKERPFTFLDHALKCGDSLVGADEVMFRNWAYDIKGAQFTLYLTSLEELVASARQKRSDLESFTVLDVRDSEHKTQLLKEADDAMARVKLGCDLLVGVRLLGSNQNEQETLLAHLLWDYVAGLPMESIDAQRALNAAHKEYAFHWPFEFPEVFEKGGFSAFVGNPPFLGGRQMPNNLGFYYTDPLRQFYDVSGPADLVCFFFRRSYNLVNKSGFIGLIATNSISETVNSEAALKPILAAGGTIYYAIKTMQWPGEAAVSVAIIHYTASNWLGIKLLNEEHQGNIAANLDPADIGHTPVKIKLPITYSQGTNVYGEAFIRTSEELDSLIRDNPGLKPYLRKYINGDILNGTVELEGDLWVIDFGELNEEEIQGCEIVISELKEKVGYERRNQIRQIHETRPWLHWDKRLKYYKAARSQENVFATVIVSSFFVIHRVPTRNLFAHGIELFLADDDAVFGVLQSSFHEYWVRFTSGSLGKTTRYTASKCLETFPFPDPKSNNNIRIISKQLLMKRLGCMRKQSFDVNQLYSLVHDEKETTEEILDLRLLHAQLDITVASAYGWSDLDLGHGFHETAQGVRFTINESARREVLSRLLQLNHERYEEEVKAGLHEKKSAKGKTAGKKKGKKISEDSGQYGLF